ncbi:MAG: hypothetical protein K8U03_04890 [Planctomycetia bacterium]|nr:hypothetical protein [Planctomycetia bacterium]
MKTLLYFTTIVSLALPVGSVAAAGESWLPFLPSYICPCPEPYCKKPAPPLVCLPPARCCDTYCKKPLPMWCRPKACCPDDYCPKPEPCCLPPLPCKGCSHCRR